MSAALATVAADAAVEEEATAPSEKTAASASRRECVVASIAFETGATRRHDAGARAASSSAADGRPRIRRAVSLGKCEKSPTAEAAGCHVDAHPCHAMPPRSRHDEERAGAAGSDTADRCICGLDECVCGLQVPPSMAGFDYLAAGFPTAATFLANCAPVKTSDRPTYVPNGSPQRPTKTAKAKDSPRHAAREAEPGYDRDGASATPTSDGGASKPGRGTFDAALLRTLQIERGFPRQERRAIDLDDQLAVTAALEIELHKRKRGKSKATTWKPPDAASAASAMGDQEMEMVGEACALELGADLIGACDAGDLDEVQRLLHEDVAPSFADARGRTPLSAAAGEGHMDLCLVLIDRGAEVDAADIDGRTPLWRACERGRDRVAACLIEFGADPSVADEHGAREICARWARDARRRPLFLAHVCRQRAPRRCAAQSS